MRRITAQDNFNFYDFSIPLFRPFRAHKTIKLARLFPVDPSGVESEGEGSRNSDTERKGGSEHHPERRHLRLLDALAAGLGPLEEGLEHHLFVSIARDQDLLLLDVALDVGHTCARSQTECKSAKDVSSRDAALIHTRRRQQGDREGERTVNLGEDARAGARAAVAGHTDLELRNLWHLDGGVLLLLVSTRALEFKLETESEEDEERERLAEVARRSLIERAPKR